MLIDSAHIQEQDALFVSKWRAKKHQPPSRPCIAFPTPNTRATLAGHAYEQTFSRWTGSASLPRRGHILGSAQVILDVGNAAAIPLAVQRTLPRRR